MNTKFLKSFLPLFLFFTMIVTAQTLNDPAKSLPDSIDGWKKLSKDRTFNDKNLYDYIDGAAELYISFGFSKVFNRIYSAGEEKEIFVDIFYMNTPPDAFGAFSFSSGKIGNDFGMQSQIAKGAIVFWKNNFYVSITSSPATDESEKLCLKLAKLIDESIKEKGTFPEIVKYLPTEALDKESIRYFRHCVWLNSHTFISNENILNITQNTHAVFAKYGDKEKSILLIVKYPTVKEAGNAKEKFIAGYNPALKQRQILKMKNGKYCGVKLVNNFFIGVFEGAKENVVKNLIDLAKTSINKLTKKNN
jgi:hypothetical protein